MFPFQVFELQPSEGLGFIKLFDSLFNIVNALNNRNLLNNVKFIYSPNSQLTIVQLASYNINLVFDSCLQRLIVIELNLPVASDSYNYRIKYKGEFASKFEFKAIYNKIFGPTFPGFLDKSTMDYYLSYPGIAFRFKGLKDELESASSNLTNGDDDGSLIQLLTNSSHDINCSSISIFRGSSWKVASQRIAEYLKDPTEKGLISLESSADGQSIAEGNSGSASIRSTGSPGTIAIRSAVVDLDKNDLTLFFSDHPTEESFNIWIGETTMNEVIRLLGPPDDYVLKPRFAKGEPTAYFKIHNYFKYGFDVVYRLDSTNAVHNCPTVKKLILHSNSVNSLEFMRYERFSFSLQKMAAVGDSGSQNGNVLSVRSFSGFDNIKNTLFSGDSYSKPIFLDRKEYELNPDNFNSNNIFELVNLDEKHCDDTNEEMKRWGLSKIYGLNRCIFEVLLEGDEVTSVTMF
ncbi:DEKNAAC102060 [Brettanomyces naardenensis]|uniref:DEKNAAC102060 n=1 Tax=Brettanomyces naardenensis TaxID=13370 RepID=A0A448YJP7_BRENA|nr:DEKNAAC102060 [Brettanomyces naardenensis]